MTRTVRLAALLLVANATARAGPCLLCDFGAGQVPLGFWNDRALSAPGRLAIAPSVDAGQDPSAVAVAWEDRTSGDGDIMVATSVDGGCSWRTTAVTSGPFDDRLPDVATVPHIDSIVIAFTRDGITMATRSTDFGATFDPPVPLGTALRDSASPPRLAGVEVAGTHHVHAVWGEAGALHRAASVAAGAPGSWVSAALGPNMPGFLEPRAPDVAVETWSDTPGTVAAVNFVFAARAPGRAVHEIFTLRSNDEGTTLFGDATDPATQDQPRRVSDPRADDPLLSTWTPRIDGSDDNSGVFYTWNLVQWSEREVGGAPGCRADARAEEGVTPTLISDWNAIDAVVATAPALAAGVSVLPNPLLRPPTPEVHLFVESLASGTREVADVRGLLNAAASPTVVTPCAQALVTGQSPPRASGEVTSASFSVDEDLSHLYLAWADTRDGISRVYWKRSDTATAPPDGVVAAPTACALGGGITLSWLAPPSPPNCDVDHYRVAWGKTSSGYSDSVEVRAGETVRLTGLDPATTYYLLVTTVDEACHERAGFEVTATTLACGAPLCPNGIGNTLQATRSGGDVSLQWNAAPIDATHHAAQSYRVYRATVVARDGYADHANPATPSYNDLDAIRPDNASPTHYYRIVAVNVCGTSADEPPP